MPLAAKRVLSFVSLSLFCLFSASSADATIFRDRAAFEAAAQNLRTIDFDTGERPNTVVFEVDGIRFRGLSFLDIFSVNGSGDRKLFAGTVGEITRLDIYLPPGTTAVGLDQFSRPMEILASTGEKVSMAAADGSDFVGFVSDQPIASLTVTLDFPEPTPDALVDNLTYGQRRAGNEPPKPLLLADATTARAAAFESVGLTPEPFDVNTPATRNLVNDGRTRVTLLVVGLKFDPASDVPFVTARAVDAQQNTYDLPVESVGGAKNFTWLAQVTVLLPTQLSGAGDLNVSVTVRGAESNKVTLRVN
ncbi:MAG TPA: hypothetical protein VF297_18510 [Pyrinomonadaceae bacterium]